MCSINVVMNIMCSNNDVLFIMSSTDVMYIMCSINVNNLFNV